VSVEYRDGPTVLTQVTVSLVASVNARLNRDLRDCAKVWGHRRIPCTKQQNRDAARDTDRHRLYTQRFRVSSNSVLINGRGEC
jgi:hypothetical protein